MFLYKLNFFIKKYAVQLILFLQLFIYYNTVPLSKRRSPPKFGKKYPRKTGISRILWRLQPTLTRPMKLATGCTIFIHDKKFHI